MLGFELIVAHMAGDYLLQNDFIAQGKHRRAVMMEGDDVLRAKKLRRISLVCGLHVLLYTLAFVVCTKAALSPWFYLSILVPHFIIDRFDLAPKLMDRIGQKGFKQHMAPWSVIVVDNTLHLVCIWVSVQVLT
jgi:hypothetical protein